ncbi:MAG: DUF4268 domain-containing protein [Bdellovibrionales bacterium]|nr:DUF4268 domain-containing protein [Bdellovibrionales bacterium]
MKKHELRDIWKNEATNFTTWMEDNMDSLSDALGFRLTVEKREQPVGSFSADILATDEYGQKVVIENQLEETDHKHLGQIITYCSNLETKICVWVAKEPRQEHINAVNWLNKDSSLKVYLLKIEAISIDNSLPAPLFQVICQPDEDVRAAAIAASEISDRGLFNIQFWTDMNIKCEKLLPGFRNRKPQKYHYHSQASGRGGLSFNFHITSKNYLVELYIDTPDADLNEHMLNILKSKRQMIEKEFGGELEFDPILLKRACRLKYVIGEGDVMTLDREKVQNHLIAHMVRFEKALKPHIKDLPFDIEDAA